MIQNKTLFDELRAQSFNVGVLEVNEDVTALSPAMFELLPTIRFKIGTTSTVPYAKMLELLGFPRELNVPGELCAMSIKWKREKFGIVKNFSLNLLNS